MPSSGGGALRDRCHECCGAQSRLQCAHSKGYYGVPLSGGGQCARFAGEHQVSDGFLEDASIHPAPRMRGLANDAPEGTSEVRLIAHATAERDLTQGGACGEHEILGRFDASTPDPGSGGSAKSAFEGTTEVARTDVDQSGKVPDANQLGQVGVDVCRDAPRLPWRKSAAHDASRRSSRDTHRRCARSSVKQGERIPDMRSGGVCVTDSCATGSLQELGGDRQMRVRDLLQRVDGSHGLKCANPARAIQPPFRGSRAPSGRDRPGAAYASQRMPKARARTVAPARLRTLSLL